MESDSSGINFWLYHLLNYSYQIIGISLDTGQINYSRQFYAQICKNQYPVYRDIVRSKYNNVYIVLSTVLGWAQGVCSQGYPLFQEFMPYLHNSNSIKFFPALGYNVSYSLTLVLLGPQKTKLILQLFFKH